VAAWVDSLELLARARAGDATALGRLLSRIESSGDEAREALAEAFKAGGRAHVLGVTGVPGSGKSTLVSRLVRSFRSAGTRVAVLAIDPSSPLSGGAFLGDRVRMDDACADPDVFIRSMASRGALGGLASAALGALDALDACGYGTVIIETVGVGQDEVAIAKCSHTTVVVSPPGLGDAIQALKAGLLEVADIHVVSKSDRPESARTVADLQTLGAMSSKDEALWKPPVIATSALTGQGIEELERAVRAHRAAQLSTELGYERERRMAEYRALATAEELLHRRFAAARGGALAALVERVARREVDPFAAARSLLAHLLSDSKP
jgi:LAO/AO transport system kinase